MYVIHICIHTYIPGNQSAFFLHLHDVLVSKDSKKTSHWLLNPQTFCLDTCFHHFSGPNAVGFPPNWRFGRCFFLFKEGIFRCELLVFPQIPFQPSRLKFKGVLSKGCKKKCWSNHHHPLLFSAQFLDVRIAVRSCAKEMWLDWNKTRWVSPVWTWYNVYVYIYIYICLLTYSHDMISPKTTRQKQSSVHPTKGGHIRVFHVSGCWHCGGSWWAWRFTDLSFFNNWEVNIWPPRKQRIDNI